LSGHPYDVCLAKRMSVNKQNTWANSLLNCHLVSQKCWHGYLRRVAFVEFGLCYSESLQGMRIYGWPFA